VRQRSRTAASCAHKHVMLAGAQHV